MKPSFLSALCSLALSYVPHVLELLDALNPRGSLRVLDFKLDRPNPALSITEVNVSGLDPVEAQKWAEEHHQGSSLRIQMPIRGGLTGALWFGAIAFEQPPHAYVRLEMPFWRFATQSRHTSIVTLTTCSHSELLNAWASAERARLAEGMVEQLVRPVIQQVEQVGFEAVALGLRTALRSPDPPTSAGLLGCVVPVLFTAWIDAWAQALKLQAPRLRRVEAEFVNEYPSESDKHGRYSPDASYVQPAVHRLRLWGLSGEPMWIAHESESRWDDDDQGLELERLRTLTGIDSVQNVDSFLDELAELMLMQYRSTGSAVLDLSHLDQMRIETLQ